MSTAAIKGASGWAGFRCEVARPEATFAQRHSLQPLRAFGTHKVIETPRGAEV